MRFPLVLLFLLLFSPVAICSATWGKAPSLVPPERNSEGWIALFNGEDLTGWEIRGATSGWSVAGGILTNTGTGFGWLATTSTWKDFDLIVEWKLSAGGNSSLFYRAGLNGDAGKTGYDVQLDEDDEANPTGSVYGLLKAKNVAAPDETWHTAEVHVEGNRHTVKVNGEIVVDGTNDAFMNGRIGLEMHDASTTVQFRKVWIRPLGLAPLFDGQSLAGWKVRKHNRQDRPPPDIRIENGAIRMQGGPGYIETESEHSDFHVRFKIKTLPRGDNSSNSGVFVRGPLVPGDNFTIWPEGVEVQVFNQPSDFTTGGFYHFVAARTVYAQDEEWFWMDVNAVENRYISWVNGMPAAVWVDPENRFVKGVLALQAHDPNSVIFYETARIAPLAPHNASGE